MEFRCSGEHNKI